MVRRGIGWSCVCYFDGSGGGGRGGEIRKGSSTDSDGDTGWCEG